MEFALARSAAVWRDLERGVGAFSLGNIIALRGRAADLRRTLDTVIMQADRRIDQLRQGKTQMKMPDDADWGWRPDVFTTRLGQISSIVRSARHNVGASIAVHHNDTDPELIVRQFKNMGVDDLAPFGLSLQTYDFKGSFLSLAIDLPREAAEELTKIIFEEITGGYSYKKLYKNEKPEDVFNKLMTGDEKLGHNDQFTVEALIKMKSILATGIRTPEEILETYLNTQTENLPEPKFSL